MTNYQMKQRIREVLQNNVKPTPRAPSTPDEETVTSGAERYYDPLKFSNQYSARVREENKFSAQNTQILGCPHQFLETADFRIDAANRFGYNFARDIFLERPIVTLMPGKVNYLPDYSSSDKKLFSALSVNDDESSKASLKALIEEENGSRYYDFKSDYTSYIKQVNMLCRLAAIYLGIADNIGPDGKTKYINYNWANYQQLSSYQAPDAAKHQSFFENVADEFYETVDYIKGEANDILSGYRMYVNFFMDPSSSVNESINNSTQKSQLEGAFDSMEGMLKEVTMLANSSSTMAGNLVGFMQTAGDGILNLANAASLGLFQNLLQTGGKEVLHGANLIYPEIWMDSEYSKSYTVQINCVSPYGTKEAIYLNCLVPLFHALGLALPRQSSANSYSSPYIIRGFSNGRFSIDMGMIESITVDKGPDETWSVDGLPTQIKITMNIKDLYSSLMMTPVNKPALFFGNQGMMDYLGCLCGVDLTTPNIVFKLNNVRAILAGARDIPQNMYSSMKEALFNATQNLVR